MSDSQTAAPSMAEDERSDEKDLQTGEQPLEELEKPSEEHQQSSKQLLEKPDQPPYPVAVEPALLEAEQEAEAHEQLQDSMAITQKLVPIIREEPVREHPQKIPEKEPQLEPDEQLQEPVTTIQEEPVREHPQEIPEKEPQLELRDKLQKQQTPGATKRRRTRSLLLTLIVLIFLGSSGVSLFQDLTSSNIYVYALDPNNGEILHQEKLGSQQNWISAPILQQGQVEVGVQQKATSQQFQLLTVKMQKNSIKLQGTQSIEQSQPVLSRASTGELISVGAQGIQVRQTNGTVLWQKAGELSIRGVHRFQPVSDEDTVYSIKETRLGEVVAYDKKDGTERWAQQLNESLEYTPPLLLDQGTLYIAGEKNLYALESSSGQVRWQVPIAGRSLEKNQDLGTLLIASSQGLLALSPETGATLWSFRGKSDEHLTPPQFYQATLAQHTAQGAVLYATGTRWRLPQIEQQTWLYAIDATTGRLLWSQALGTGFISGDSGRIFAPLIDQSRQSVIIQHQESLDQQQISAYNLSNGTLRWSSTIQGVQQSAPELLQLPDGTLFLFAVVNNSSTALATLPPARYLLLLAALLSLLSLFLLWAPRLLSLKTKSQAVFILQAQERPLLKRSHVWSLPSSQNKTIRNTRGKRILIVLGLLFFLFGVIFLAYRQFNEGQAGIYQVDASNGRIQWQQTDQQGVLEGIDRQGSVSIQHQRNIQWLQANTASDNQWQSFASEGNFHLATNLTGADILLASLTSNKQLNYQFAPADPGYPDALTDLFILTGFARADGQLKWQTVVAQPQEHRQFAVLGADQRYLYLSSKPDTEASDQTAKEQLLAVNQQTGNIDWRIYGSGGGTQKETLLLLKERLIWEVRGRIYLLDANSGQIEWQRTLPGSLGNEQQIEQLAVTSSGQLLLATQESLYSIEQDSGALLWEQPLQWDPGMHMIATGGSVFLVQEKQIQAYSATSPQLLWTKPLSGKLQSIVSDTTGKAIYMSIQESGHNQAIMLLALESEQGRELWHELLPEQTEQAEIINNQRGRLLVSICEQGGRQSCGGKRLYMFDGIQGKILWKSESRTMSTIRIDPTGNSIAFQSR